MAARYPARLAAALVTLAMTGAGAAQTGLEGRWSSVDAGTGKPRAVIEVRALGREFVGHIVEYYPGPGEPVDPVCEACKGNERGAPIRGLAILRLAPQAGGGWSGTVLDPDEGDVYRAEARLEDGGQRLALRGYVLLPIFGRSESWTRIP